MKNITLEWNKGKEKVNIKKHGISFSEAQTVFYDENVIQFYDPDHSNEEGRFILYLRDCVDKVRKLNVEWG